MTTENLVRGLRRARVVHVKRTNTRGGRPCSRARHGIIVTRVRDTRQYAWRKFCVHAVIRLPVSPISRPRKSTTTTKNNNVRREWYETTVGECRFPNRVVGRESYARSYGFLRNDYTARTINMSTVRVKQTVVDYPKSVVLLMNGRYEDDDTTPPDRATKYIRISHDDRQANRWGTSKSCVAIKKIYRGKKTYLMGFALV